MQRTNIHAGSQGIISVAIEKARLDLTRSIMVPALAGIVGALVAALAIGLIVYWWTDFRFLRQDACGVYNGAAFCVLDDRWDTETYLSTISAFYGTIITVLIGLLAFVAAFAFFAVRASALSHAEDKVAEEVHRYFSDSKSGDERITAILAELSKVRNQSLSSRVDNIETQLSEQGLLNLSDLEVGQ